MRNEFYRNGDWFSWFAAFTIDSMIVLFFLCFWIALGWTLWHIIRMAFNK